MESSVVIGRRWNQDWIKREDGVSLKIVYRDDDTHHINMLAKFPPGFSELPHSHDHEHSVVVIEGSQEVDGHVLTVGDSHYTPANAEHGPFLYPEGCVLFVSMRGPSALNVLAAPWYVQAASS